MVAKIITTYLLGLLYGCVLSLIITPIFLFLKKKIFDIPVVRKIMIKKAARNGHIVTSMLKLRYNTIPTRMRPGQENGMYIFDYNGRTYTYDVNYSIDNLPDELTLYFLKKPSKARSVEKIGIGEIVGFKKRLKFYFVIANILAIAFLAFKM